MTKRSVQRAGSQSTQFKKGVSGNPKGRPKKTSSAANGASMIGLAGSISATAKALDDALNNKVTITTPDGRRKSITKRSAMAIQLANKGAQGDPRATKQVFDVLEKIGEPIQAVASAPTLTQTDEQIIANVILRIRQCLEYHQHCEQTDQLSPSSGSDLHNRCDKQQTTLGGSHETN
jgi:selenophosphate synthase